MATNYPTSLDAYSTKADGVDDVLAQHVNNLQDAIVAIETALGIGAWVDWAPTVTQSGSVTVNILEARYKIVNGLVVVRFRINITGTGTSGNDIIVGNLPAALSSTIPASSVFPVGTGVISDTGTASYYGAWIPTSTTNLRMVAPSVTNLQKVGTNPSFALAANDNIAGTLIWAV